MRKVSIVIFYTTGVCSPENQGFCGDLREWIEENKCRYDIVLREVENKDKEEFLEICKEEVIKFNDCDYGILLDGDYLCVRFSRIKDLLESFLRDEVNEVEFPFLKCVKKKKYHNSKIATFGDVEFDTFELLDCKKISAQSLSLIKNISCGNEVLFIDCFLLEGCVRVFDIPPLPIIHSKNEIRSFRIGDDYPLSEQEISEEVKNIVEAYRESCYCVVRKFTSSEMKTEFDEVCIDGVKEKLIVKKNGSCGVYESGTIKEMLEI